MRSWRHALVRWVALLALPVLVGCGPSADSRPSGESSSPAQRTPADATGGAGWKFDLEGIAIPTHSARGLIHGKSFSYERAEIENGILSLRQGQDVFADRQITVFLFLDEGVVPAGQTLRVDRARQSTGVRPHIYLSWRENGKDGMPKHDAFMQEYALLLEFGQEKDKKLPGKIYAALPDESKSWVAGSFEAEIKGYRLIEGKPDLTLDSFKLFDYLAKGYLEKRHPGQAITVTDRKYGIIEHPAQTATNLTPTGYQEVLYKVGDARPARLKFQFVKDQGQWRVLRTLKKSEIHQAHPSIVPDRAAEPFELFPYLVAQRLERDLQEKFAGRRIGSARFSWGYNPEVKLGEGKVSFRLEGDKKDRKKVYLMRLDDKGWWLDRELAMDEVVDYRTAQVQRKSR